MANLKSITELPVAESAEGLNLIVNDNGAAKQISASAVGAQADFAVTDETSPAFIKNKPAVAQADWTETDENNPAFIKNKPKSELVHEWNFSAEDCVYEVMENIGEELIFLASSLNNISWKIHVECYGITGDGTEDNNMIVLDDCVITSIIPDYYAGWFTNLPTGEKEVMSAWFGSNSFNIGDYTNECHGMVTVINGMQFGENGDSVPIDGGGAFMIFNDSDNPFKSIKIYKEIN